MDSTYTTLAAWAIAIGATLNANGVSPPPVFARAGLSFEQIKQSPTERIPIERMTRLWNEAVIASDNPAFGLGVAAHVHPMHFRALGMLTVTCQNIEQSLRKIIHYHALISDAVTLSLTEESDRLGFTIEAREGVTISDAAIDAFFSVIQKFCMEMVHAPGLLQEVWVRRSAPANPEPWQQHFRLPVRFAQARNCLWLTRSVLQLDSVHGDAHMAELNELAVVQSLQQMQIQTLSQRCRAAIQFSAEEGAPTLEAVAQFLQVSPRTLARKLKQEGVTFNQLLQEKRRTLSVHYLTHSNEPITNIALSLGFRDTSNFNRAFQRWFNTTPSQFRESQSQRVLSG
ncbi:AraC family transcriptional regulator [Ferrimonas balearica]|uniref:AraC family transcriptional regulator n=1 Tax=Ferrimonas balearica TaxID=44012 RepID=UPI001C94CD7F|nr:AraC family transcriptional regulator [Ferrimonas balearica]MBY5980463.1 AraC family transcriptional regulator [Ferrimonas balearica]